MQALAILVAAATMGGDFSADGNPQPTPVFAPGQDFQHPALPKASRRQDELQNSLRSNIRPFAPQPIRRAGFDQDASASHAVQPAQFSQKSRFPQRGVDGMSESNFNTTASDPTAGYGSPLQTPPPAKPPTGYEGLPSLPDQEPPQISLPTIDALRTTPYGSDPTDGYAADTVDSPPPRKSISLFDTRDNPTGADQSSPPFAARRQRGYVPVGQQTQATSPQSSYKPADAYGDQARPDAQPNPATNAPFSTTSPVRQPVLSNRANSPSASTASDMGNYGSNATPAYGGPLVAQGEARRTQAYQPANGDPIYDPNRVGGQVSIGTPPAVSTPDLQLPQRTYPNSGGSALPQPTLPELNLDQAASAAAERIRQSTGGSYFLTLLALFASIGLNLYLGWIAWDTYNKYQDLVAGMRFPSGSRRERGERRLAESSAF